MGKFIDMAVKSVQQQEEARNFDSKSERKRTCFIITPVGDINSTIRRSMYGMVASIRRVLEEEDFILIAPLDILTTGSITTEIVSHIIDSDLVIADLTGLNPNVMYELAIRHATLKPVITITDNIATLPFDIQDQRAIRYVNDIQGYFELCDELRKTIPVVMKQANHDNPIYRAKQQRMITDSINKTGSTDSQLLLSAIHDLEKRFELMAANTNNSIAPINVPTRSYIADISQVLHTRRFELDPRYPVICVPNIRTSAEFEQLNEILKHVIKIPIKRFTPIQHSTLCVLRLNDTTSAYAAKVVEKLNENGYHAFLVDKHV